MLKDYLPRDIYNLIIKNFSFETINEIRMRAGEKLIIVVGKKKFHLKNNDDCVTVSQAMLEQFILKISENSLYAFNDNIINGYITLPKGIRVGISGNVVTDGDRIVTIKEFQAVNIRIPHFIKNCSLPAYEYIVGDNIRNTLIVSPPGAGKTTFLRDFIYQLHEHNLPVNVLVADERNEIASVVKGESNINLGGFCDIYSNCSKQFAFKNGIRSMCPDVIVTDEIDLDKDMNSILEAINCGVSVVATIHAKDINQLKKKKSFDYIVNEKLFSRYIVLSKQDELGVMTNIYDEKLNCIYCRCL